VSFNATTFYDRDRALQGVFAAARDITERKQAETVQARLQAQLQQAQKMDSLGCLAGGVAHDMNNVLAAILALASANLGPEAEHGPSYLAFDTIAKAAVRGGQVVKSLLSVARESPAEVRDLDINALLQEEIRLLERTTLAKVRLEVDLAADLRPIRGDGSALSHAFINLCVNAVEAMAGNGVLTLRTRNVDNAWIELLVGDTGCGMTKIVQAQALNPFFTTKEVGKGTGLGLSMVYRTVRSHNGQLDIQSEPGRGTRMRLRFPAIEPAAGPAAPASIPQPRRSKGALSVLLVDDDELIRSSVERLLAAMGHTVTAVASGEAALVLLEADFRPEVVILDINMPGIGGCGTLPRLRALRPICPSCWPPAGSTRPHCPWCRRTPTSPCSPNPTPGRNSNAAWTRSLSMRIKLC
jgi:CheY-like chemotaxis protein